MTDIEHDSGVDARRTEALRRVYVWITAWTEMARTVVRRRDQQIRLGIAKQRRSKKPSTARDWKHP